MLTREDYMNAVEYYMQKKYGEKFEGEYIVDNSIYVHPKAKPEWHAVVEVYSKNGLTYFSDNYVGYLKKAELEKYIYELVKPIYGECKVYTQPYNFSLDDSFNIDTDIMTYVNRGNYITCIFTYKKAKNIEKDFRKVCDIFLDKNLQTNRLLVTYFTKEDFDKFEEYRMDYIFNQQKYYYRISSFYSKVDKVGFDEVKILEGDEKYGKWKTYRQRFAGKNKCRKRVSILTDKKAENIEEDFIKVCDTFSNKNLQGDKLYVLYVTKEDLDKFEEYRMDYVFNKCNYYYRISRLYDNVDKTWLDDIDILQGDKGYGKW